MVPRNINFFPTTLIAVVLTNHSHPSIIPAPALSLSNRSVLYLFFPTARKIGLHFWPSLLGTLPVFLLFLVYPFFIYTISYLAFV